MFSQIPAAWLVPGAFFEVDASLAEAGVGAFPLRGLIIGQRLASGFLAAAIPERVTSAEDASALAGPGSVGSRMATQWFSVNLASELDLILLDDDAASSPNVVTLTLGGSPAIGVLPVYVAGSRYQVSAAGSLAQTAQAIADVVNADPEAPFAVAVNPGDTSQVIFTAKHGGEATNQLDVRVAHLEGEAIPSGLTVTIVDTQSGAGNPDVTLALSAIQDVQYDIIVHPFTDAANLTALEDELESRDAATRAIPGHAFTAEIGSVGLLGALGDSRNSRNSTIVGMAPFPGAAHERAAAVAAWVAFSGSIDPARPFQTLAVPGFAPRIEDQFSDEERNLLLLDGIATMKHDRTGETRIERLVTTNKTNEAGAPTAAFREVNIRLLLSFFRKAGSARVLQRFPRHKIASDGPGQPSGPGTNIVTPRSYIAEWVSFYQELIDAGLAEDMAGFVKNSSASRPPADPNRIEALLAPNFVNGLRTQAVLVQFRV